TSGVYMSLSRLYRAMMNSTTWKTGFTNLTLNSTTLNVDIQDHSEDPNLSSMELRIVSTGTYGNISKNIEVLVGIPPNLADLAVFATKNIINVTVTDQFGAQDSSLFIQNVSDMLPFDTDGLVALANSQPGHVIAGDFSPPDGWFGNNFYYDVANNIPNVTHVLGDFTVTGGTTVYGIVVVEGNADLNGNARLDGVLYLPNPGSIVLNGGGAPAESAVTGGIFANGTVDGQGNHISIEYKREYMEIFGSFQINIPMYIISWVESPDM
ncbi:MAG TPA: hypothetical protein VGD14_16360, partial [bacterium]